MSDYARQHDFSTKTGTTIFGSDVDDEFDALVTAVNSKVDESREGAANGIATLGAGALIPAGISGDADSGGGQIPEASATALGAVELATAAEATALTDAARVITCATLNDVVEQLPGTGLTESAGVLSLSHLGLEALTGPGADRIAFWDQSALAFKWLSLDTDLVINATVLGVSTLSDSSVVESNVTQHEAALTITESQISDLNTYLVSGAVATTLSIGNADTTLSRDAAGQLAVEGAPVYTQNDGTLTSAKVFFSTSAPVAEGSNGDVWYEYTA